MTVIQSITAACHFPALGKWDVGTDAARFDLRNGATVAIGVSRDKYTGLPVRVSALGTGMPGQSIGVEFRETSAVVARIIADLAIRGQFDVERGGTTYANRQYSGWVLGKGGPYTVATHVGVVSVHDSWVEAARTLALVVGRGGCLEGRHGLYWSNAPAVRLLASWGEFQVQ